MKQHIDELELEIINLKESLKEVKSSSIQILSEQTHKCCECSKMFYTEEHLMSHTKRRHDQKNINLFQIETDKLQLEIKELKERLNSTEKYIQTDHNLKNRTEESAKLPDNDTAMQNNKVQVEVLQDKFELLKQHVEMELTILRSQKNYHEKYEKWFELVFERINSSKRESNDQECDVEVGKHDLVKDIENKCTEDAFTQTENQVIDMAVKLPLETIDISKSNIDIQSLNKEVDIKKIEEEIKTTTEAHFVQIQELLDEKVRYSHDKEVH